MDEQWLENMDKEIDNAIDEAIDNAMYETRELERGTFTERELESIQAWIKKLRSQLD